MKTILVLTDFSKRAERASEFALELAVNNSANLLLYNSIILLELGMPLGGRSLPDGEILKKKQWSLNNLI